MPSIIYDANCKLCNSAVRFLKTREGSTPMDYFPASDPKSEQLLSKHGISREVTDKTVIFVDNNHVYIKSTAVIKALQKRSGIWKAAILLTIIPLFIRDKIYDWIARRRA